MRSSGSQHGAPGRRLRLLFTSAGRRVSLLGHFRRAARELGVPLTIHAADCEGLAPALRKADHAVVVPPVAEEGYVEALLDYCRRARIDAVIPLIDPELAVLAGARERFEAAGTRCIVSDASAVAICTDKLRTGAFLSENGFRAPRILRDDELAAAPLPLFVKPRDGSSSIGARAVGTRAELDLCRRIQSDCIVQEYIEAPEYTVDVFTDLDGRPLCAVPRRRLQVRGGEVVRSRTVRHEGLIRQSLDLAGRLRGARGPLTIQGFLTGDEQVVFIEINARFGGGVPLSIQAGADSPRWLLEMLLGRVPAIDPGAWREGLTMLRYDQELYCPPEPPPS